MQLTDARDEVTKAYQGIAELRGFDIDVTPSGAAQQAAITEAVAEIAVNRACFEQVKGILMLVYRIDADVAFDLLKWRSQETNVKLRVWLNSCCPMFEHWNTTKTRRPVQRSTAYSSQRTNASEPRQLAADLNPRCGGVVQRPAWTPQNLAGARKLTTPLSQRRR